MSLIGKGQISAFLKSSILKNYLFMSTYQVVNFLIPIVIIPFVIKQVGFANFGLTAFSYAFVNYFLVLTDYGFNLSATREISICRTELKKVNEVFNKVLTSKIYLLGVCFAVFMLLITTVPIFKEQFILHLLGFSVVAAQVFLPLWLFQGLEEMKFIAILNTISKLISMVLIFCLVREPSDYIYVNMFLGLGGIFACLICFVFILKKYKLKFHFISSQVVYAELKAGYSLFLSSFAVNVYVNSNSFILGLIVTPVALAYYSVAEKVLLALKQLTSVFSQVIYPHVCLLAEQSIGQVKSFFKKAMLPFLICIILASSVIFIFAPEVVKYFLKSYNSEATLLIRYLSVVPIIVALDIPAFQTLLAYNKKKEYSLVLSTACILSIICNFLLANLLGSTGTVISVIITELYVTIYLSYLAYYKVVLSNRNG